jgi:uncharacterized protein YndB with AHSA1/START domain
MAEDTGQVTRSVDLDAGLDDVWRAVTEPGERALWLDDPDAVARRVRVDEADPGRRLVWTWWHPGDEGDASTVAVTLAPLDGGRTRLVVTETLPARPTATMSARASAGAVTAVTAGTAVAAGAAGTRLLALGRRDCPWGHRLLGLELLFVAARAGVA